MTPKQQQLLAILRSEPQRGFDCDELAGRLQSPRQGISRTAASLEHQGLVVRFIGGCGPQRVYYQAAGVGA